MEKVCVKYRPIVPLLYDDSLTYYEAVAKLAHKVNEMIDAYNGVVGPINNIQTTVNQAAEAVQNANTALNSANTALGRTLALQDDIDIAVTSSEAAVSAVNTLNNLPHILSSVNQEVTVGSPSTGTFTVHWRVNTYSDDVIECTGYCIPTITKETAVAEIGLGQLPLPVPMSARMCELVGISDGQVNSHYTIEKYAPTSASSIGNITIHSEDPETQFKFRLDFYIKGKSIL